MKQLIEKLEEKGIQVYEYKEDDTLCGYELNTYTDGGVNQIIFIDFRNTEKDPTSEEDFKQIFLARINDIDIDEEIDVNRQDKLYKQNFTISQSVTDFTDWKNKLLSIANNI